MLQAYPSCISARFSNCFCQQNHRVSFDFEHWQELEDESPFSAGEEWMSLFSMYKIIGIFIFLQPLSEHSFQTCLAGLLRFSETNVLHLALQMSYFANYL